MTLKIVTPLPLSDAALVGSSVPENDHPVWAAGATYAIGQRVIRTSKHTIYERVVAGTTATAPEVDLVNWQEVGPTNRWAMFDQVNSSKTTATGEVIVEIRPAKLVNTLALLSVDAESVRVEMIDPQDGTVYDRTYLMVDNGTVTDWYQFYFAPIKRKRTLVLTDLPAYSTALLRITLQGAGTVSCGTCIFGAYVDFGEGVEVGASADILDFSSKERDRWGNYVFTRGRNAKLGKWPMKVMNTQIDAFQEFIADLSGTPALWIGCENYSATIIYGFYRGFSLVIAYDLFSECDLEIEGLT